MVRVLPLVSLQACVQGFVAVVRMDDGRQGVIAVDLLTLEQLVAR